jgi:hypothetical protein
MTTTSPISLGTQIATGIVPAFHLTQTDLAILREDLTWLFAAADHYLKICRGEIDRDAPVALLPPADIEPQDEVQAQSRLLTTLDDELLLPIWELKLELTILKPIEYNWNSLAFLLDREAQRGQDGRDDLTLQKEIQAHRVEIIRFVARLADFTERAYGVKLTSPHDLVERLEMS